MSRCKITQDGNDLVLSFPYDAGMVAALKSSIPANERRYDPNNKTWRIAINKAAKIQNLCHIHFNELPLVPQNLKPVTPIIKQKILDVRYIGITKDRNGDERSAYGWYQEGWNIVFPESVLRAWFDAPSQPDEQPNLYSVLGVRREATEEEIKTGWRRMVMQWHPDRCKEPNTQDQFIAIQRAYEVLTKDRERYDAGLALEASLRNNPPTHTEYHFANNYRSPLRCGLIMCEGIESMGLFQVSKIFTWEDVKDQYGRVLVVSWPHGADHFEEVWA